MLRAILIHWLAAVFGGMPSIRRGIYATTAVDRPDASGGGGGGGALVSIEQGKLGHHEI
eukprot:SAG31_NODE_62_length_28678_cov_21.548270_15_plen_59_part_00